MASHERRKFKQRRAARKGGRQLPGKGTHLRFWEHPPLFDPLGTAISASKSGEKGKKPLLPLFSRFTKCSRAYYIKWYKMLLYETCTSPPSTRPLDCS